MSYDIALTRPNDTMVTEEDQIIDYDHKTVTLLSPMLSTYNVVLKINDFVRSSDFQTEVIVREDVTSQFNGNTDTISVAQAPIYDGMKIGNVSTHEEDVVVKIKVLDEDVSGQLVGIDNYFFLQGHPLLRSNNYDFSSLITKDDIVVKVNAVVLPTTKIQDINPITGRVQLVDTPLVTDVVTVTYFFNAKIKIYDAMNGRIVLKEKPVVGQPVTIQYFARVNDGWTTQPSVKLSYANARDIVFYRYKNTHRVFVNQESVSTQVTGKTNTFTVSRKPLLPLFESFYDSPDNTLNNSVVVTVNGSATPVRVLDARAGTITTFIIPQPGDTVLVSYFYQDDFEPDRISIDYATDRKYCSKSQGHINIADYNLTTLGSYAKVERENKLIQDLRKIIVTNLGSDPVATWYGTNFESFIGSKLTPDYVKTRISGEIVEALTRLKTAQIQQEQYQEVTPNEFLDFIQKITVTQAIQEPTYYRAVVNVVTQAGKAYEVNEPLIYSSDRLFAAGTY